MGHRDERPIDPSPVLSPWQLTTDRSSLHNGYFQLALRSWHEGTPPNPLACMTALTIASAVTSAAAVPRVLRSAWVWPTERAEATCPSDCAWTGRIARAKPS